MAFVGNQMRIVADKQIENVSQAFSKHAQVLLYDGHEIDAEKIHRAHALLVRSVSRVDKNLLHGSQIKFVASATSGQDHIDINYLKRQHIGFSDAAGANARAVAEYVLSSLFVLADQAEFSLQEKLVAIIGCGQVGSLIVSMLEAIGVETLMYDPPLQTLASSDEIANRYCNREAVYQADIISLHVPLTLNDNKQAYPTKGLIGADFLSKLKDDVILLNTSRGDVVDESALKQHLLIRPAMQTVLDVWSEEPNIDLALLAAITIGTPHIAGYSAEAKQLASHMVCQSTYDFFQCDISLPSPRLPELDAPVLIITDSIADEDAIRMAVLTSYDVRYDRLSIIDNRQFSMLRHDYPLRREFSAITVKCLTYREQLIRCLQQLGFKVCFS